MTHSPSTKELRALIERPRPAWLWGQRHMITPRLIATKFGDGQKLVCIWPIMTRPSFFVARVDSSVTDIAAEEALGPGSEEFALLDAIQEAQEEEYGCYNATGDDGKPLPDDERQWPVVDWDGGSTWDDPIPISEWKPTPPPCTGRQRTRALWRKRGRR